MLGSYKVWIIGGLAGLVIGVGVLLVWPESSGPVARPSARAAPPTELPGPSAAAKEHAAAPPDEEQADDPQPLPVATDGLEQLGRRELESGMAKVHDKVLRCRDVEHFVGTVDAHLVIVKSGAVQSAQVLPPNEHSATAQCVVKAVKQAAFPRFRGTLHPTVELTYPFLFKNE